MTDTYDVLIVGGGPGGAVTADELVAEGFSVGVLERGSLIQNSSIPLFNSTELRDRYFNRGMSVAVGRNPVSFVEAACLGGGSRINSGLYHRTPLKVLEKWSDQGILSEADVRESGDIFETIERRLNVSLSPMDQISRVSKLFARGAELRGLDYREIPRWYEYRPNEGWICNSVSKVYLESSDKVVKHTKHNVHAIEKNGILWIVRGVQDIDGISSPFEYSCNYLFLCGGATSTPAIIFNNIKNRNVGKHLYMHPSVKLVAEFDTDVNGDSPGVGIYQSKLESLGATLGASASSLPHLALMLSGHETAHEEVLENWRRMSAFYASISGGRGGLRKTFYGTLIPFFNLTGNELQSLKKAALVLANLLFSAGSKRIYPIDRNGVSFSDVATFGHYLNSLKPSQLELMTIHLMGTVSMGDKNTSVCDFDGKVHGVDNLYVNDCSIIPGPLGVNPQGTVMYMAYRNVRRFISRHKYG